MQRNTLLLAIVAATTWATPLNAQQTIVALFQLESGTPAEVPICIPLSVANEFAKLENVTIEVPVDPVAPDKGKGAHRLSAQLTSPSFSTERIPAQRDQVVRRDLYFYLPLAYRGQTIKVYAEEFTLNKANTFAWRSEPDRNVELLFTDRPISRYVHTPYDNSTTAKRDKTYKVFHHLFDPTGKRLITNGGDINEPLPKNSKDLLYPHHRGLMYAFNEITFDGNKKCDTWHAKPGDTHQSHEGFLVQEAGTVMGRHRVAVNWHGPKSEVFAKEEREITVYKMEKGTLVDFGSRLKTTGGPVKLAGDPQHAGFQFRAHNDLHEQKNDKLTYYLRPDGKGKPGETRNWDPKTKKGPVNLPWDAMCFVIDGKRYTVAYLNHPNNPGESRWSERDYGRFGCYFEYELTEQNPLVVQYRVWLQEGEMTVDEVAALHRAFTVPPKVVVK